MTYSNLLKLSTILLFSSCTENKKAEPLNDQKKTSSTQAPKSEQPKKQTEAKKQIPNNHQEKPKENLTTENTQNKKAPKREHQRNNQNTTSKQNHSRISDVLTDTENILPKVAQSLSNVVVGDNGGRIIKGAVELTLNEADQLTLIFDEIQKPNTKITVLINSEPAILNQEGNTYTTKPITEKLPAEINLSITTPEETITDIIQIDSGQCNKCNNLKLACTCDN